jgi:hypothetical protein
MRRFSDQAGIRTAKARIRAHLYEVLLFGDDPVLILRAQKNLLLWNVRYLQLALTSAMIVALPALLIAAQLDALYGKRALAQGESAVVTVELKPAVGLDSLDPVLIASTGFHVETASVRVASAGQICWRVRAGAISDGMLQFRLPHEIVECPIRAGPGLRYVSAICKSSIFGLVLDGCRISSSSAQSIQIDYPDGYVSFAGFQAHWMVWFAIFWLATMLVVRSHFGVTF